MRVRAPCPTTPGRSIRTPLIIIVAANGFSLQVLPLVVVLPAPLVIHGRQRLAMPLLSVLPCGTVWNRQRP